MPSPHDPTARLAAERATSPGAASRSHAGDSQPLAGITVLEIGQNVAAPFAGQVLADLGAEVVKVEKSDGDDARGWGPPFWEGASALFQCFNRNKKSVVIDFRDDGQRRALHDFIVGQTDVVVQNMRPGLLGRHGFDAETLMRERPGLVWCDMGAFGRGGPLETQPGYDPLMQAFGGLMSVTGEPGDAPPVRTGYSVIDMSTGLWAVVGVLAALQRRQATGRGSVVDVSLYESALAWMGAAAAQYRSSDRLPGRHGSGAATIVPYRAFRTRDGHLVVAAGNDGLFRRLSKALGHPEWADDPRFATNPARVQNREAIDALIAPLMASAGNADWSARLAAAGIPVAPVQTVDQAFDHPQARALGMEQPVPGSDMTLVALPLRFDGVRPPIRQAPPALDADGAWFRGELPAAADTPDHSPVPQ